MAPTPPLILISAMSHDRVIGCAGGMPWSVPAEYAHYLSQVRGHTVVMGRRSYEIFGADLSHGSCLVLSRRLSPGAGYEVFGDLPALLARARQLGRPIFVAGGGQVYAQCLPLADYMQLSEIKGTYAGDVWFPEWDPTSWSLRREEDRGAYIYREWARQP